MRIIEPRRPDQAKLERREKWQFATLGVLSALTYVILGAAY